MGLPKFSTPYYLSGRQRESWHKNKAEKAAFKSMALAGVGGALTYKKTRQKIGTYAMSGGTKYHRAAAEAVVRHKPLGLGLLGAGAATAAYGGYHARKAKIEQTARRKPAKNKRI